MCTAGDRLTPEARALVGRLLGDLADAVAAMVGCDPADVTIGPVDLDPEPTP